MKQFHWRLPMHGDRAVAGASVSRGDWSPLRAGNQTPGLQHGASDAVPYHDHLLEIAKAVELAGFDGALIPSFPNTDDPWVAASSIARATRTFRFMIAFQPPWIDPVYAAKASASLQRLSGGRLLFNIITGGGGPGQLWWGDRIAHDDRYRRTTEWLDVFKGVWNGGPFDYDGKFYQVRGAGLPAPLAGQVLPEFYFAGSSDAALAAQGKHADFNLTHLEPFEQLRIKFDRVKELASKEGRTVKPAVRLNILARATEEEAWDEVRAGWARADWDGFEKRFGAVRGDAVGSVLPAQFRPARDKRVEELIVAPNLWAGFLLLGDPPALGIVGSYEQAAERLDDLIRIGVEGFILAGTPHLEEALRVGEEVIPLVRESNKPSSDEIAAFGD
jgi:alkanesulfonate monooxygenase